MTIAEDILNRAIELGNEKSDAANEAAEIAQTAALGYTTLVAPVLGPTPAIDEPDVFIPTTAAGVDTALFDSTYDRIINDLSDQFAAFFTEYFPLDADLLESVVDWLKNAIDNGGSGINAVVEDQIWQRDRDRLTRAGLSAEEETVASWAGRGFPLPPGALIGAVEQARRDRDLKIADQSRDRAIKTFEQEIENVRFAITSSIDLRVKALGAASDYIRSLALAPQIAGQLSVASASAQANLISSVASFYAARVRVAEFAYSPQRLNAEMTLRAGEVSAQGFNARLALQANTAVSIAQSMGAQAASALNAVNGTSQIIQQLES